MPIPIADTVAGGVAAVLDFFAALPEKIRERMRAKARADLAEGARILAEAQKEAEEITKRAKEEGTAPSAPSPRG